jgi:hypothetical protein
LRSIIYRSFFKAFSKGKSPSCNDLGDDLDVLDEAAKSESIELVPVKVRQAHGTGLKVQACSLFPKWFTFTF